eukprot:5839890-Prymnesium_polylepis.1
MEVEVTPAVAHAPALPAARWTVEQLFTYRLDVFGVPRRSFFSGLAHFASSAAHAERLREFAAPKGAAELA